MRFGLGWAWLVCSVVCGCSLSSNGNAIDGGARDVGPPDTDASAGPATLVVGNLLPDESCVVDENSNFVLKGTYDVSAPAGCVASYPARLLVQSFLVSPGLPDGAVGIAPNAVQVTDAVVTLLDASGSAVNVGTQPNPFSVSTAATIPAAQFEQPGSGVALVEVIPSSYRPFLADLAALGATIVAEIALTATTVDGTRVDPEPFLFPIELCAGCLTACESAFTPEEINELLAGTCRNNPASDGRICIDPGC